MSYGYNFDKEIRDKVITAVEKYKASKLPDDYVILNNLIMEIQKPYIELLDKIRALL